MPHRLSTLALLLGTLAASTGYAQEAQDPQKLAESHYQTAARLFGEGRYVEALQEFDKAIAISPESIFYCNRAVVLIKLGEPQDALASLESCQNTFTGGETELAEIDAQRLGVERMVHHVRAGALDTVNRINAPKPTDEPSGGWNRASTGYVFLGVGGALLASAVTLDRLSVDVKERYVDEAGGTIGGTEEDYLAAREAYVQRQRIWLGLTVGGAAVAAVGASLVVWHFLGESRVSVVPNASGAGPAVRYHW